MKRLIGAEIRNLQNTISRHIDNYVNSIVDVQISGTNMFLLNYLYDHKNQNVFQKDLESVFAFTKSTCSKVLSLMQEKELIVRESVNDARFNKIVLTKNGEMVVENMRAKIAEHDKALTQGLTEEQLQVMLHCFEIIKQNVKKQQEKLNKANENKIGEQMT